MPPKKLLLKVTAEVLASNGDDVAVHSFSNEVEHNGLDAGGHAKTGAESYQSFLALAAVEIDEEEPGVAASCRMQARRCPRRRVSSNSE